MSSATELRDIALAEFASAGYSGTSIQRIADVAGLSKSAVLYHFPSKEILLEAVLTPAIDRMAVILAELAEKTLTGAARQEFLGSFVDLLLDYRLQVYMFINQGPSLVDVPVIERANELVRGLAAYFASNTGSTEEKMRFGIALGGAAYMLCSPQGFELDDVTASAGPSRASDSPAASSTTSLTTTADETRAALVTILTELLAPVSARSLT